MGNGVTNDVRHHEIPVKDAKSTILVDEGDKTSLKVYKSVLKTTLTAAIDHLLGLAMRCYEEKHDEEIQELKERDRFQASYHPTTRWFVNVGMNLRLL